MSEPVLDMSEIVELYKIDARTMIQTMQADLQKWQNGTPMDDMAKELRRLSHQLRGSGRTYGFRHVTRLGKAIEKIVLKLEAHRLSWDEPVRQSLAKKIEQLKLAFQS